MRACLTAASGKTTLGDGAGTIEASLIQTEALNKAGWVIARLVQSVDGSNTVVLMSKSDAIDLSSVQSIQDNITTLSANFPENGKDGKPLIPCVDSPSKGPPAGGEKGGKETKALLPWVTTAGALESIPSLLATDTSIDKMEVDEDDRVLIEAIMMNDCTSGQASQWQPATGPIAAQRTAAAVPTYVLPSESIHATTDGSALYKSFSALRREVADAQKCTNATWKSASAAAATFITAATTVGEKGAAPPLTVALEQEAFIHPGNDVPRVSIERTCGTSITRQGVLFTLGFPNAAMVSSGLVVSFRLMNPANGRAKLVGLVRCSAKPINFKKAQAAINNNQEGVDCSYVSNAPSPADRGSRAPPLPCRFEKKRPPGGGLRIRRGCLKGTSAVQCSIGFCKCENPMRVCGAINQGNATRIGAARPLAPGLVAPCRLRSSHRSRRAAAGLRSRGRASHRPPC